MVFSPPFSNHPHLNPHFRTILLEGSPPHFLYWKVSPSHPLTPHFLPSHGTLLRLGVSSLTTLSLPGRAGVAPRLCSVCDGAQGSSLPGADGLHVTVSESVLSLWSLKTSSKSCETLAICGGHVVPLCSPRDCPVGVPQVYVTDIQIWLTEGAAFGNVLPMLCLRER